MRTKPPLLPPYDPVLVIEPLRDEEIAGIPGALDEGEPASTP